MAAVAAVWNSKKTHKTQSKVKVKLELQLLISVIILMLFLMSKHGLFTEPVLKFKFWLIFCGSGKGKLLDKNILIQYK